MDARSQFFNDLVTAGAKPASPLPRPTQAERDAYVLDMISMYLSGGKSSVLYKKIIDEQKECKQNNAIIVPCFAKSLFSS